MSDFIGRENELGLLTSLLDQKLARLIVIKGRRRIGKSRLLAEYGKVFKKAYYFSGLAPDKGVTAQHQRDEFARQLGVQFGIIGIDTSDWGNLFWHLSQNTKTGRVLIVFDEISWMARHDPTFLPKLKIAWDEYFKKNDQLILALCSSISLWIEKNILNSKGFMGRQSLILTLDELPVEQCKQFWPNAEMISANEKLLLLSVTGGVPRYLEEMNPKLPVEQNIKNMCFMKEGILFNEFHQIFKDLFNENLTLYQRIIGLLADGSQEAKQLFRLLNISDSGTNYEHLENLAKAGFITLDYTWKIKDGKISRLSKYRLSDNYCRFYIKFIEPNRHKILNNDFQNMSLTNLPAWSSLIGLQFENLVLKNRNLIKSALEIMPQEIVCDNPFFQNATHKQQGCQVDYLIQTRFNTIYLCEIKYSKHQITLQVIDEMKEKIQRLSLPKNFSVRPVLIHCNSVSEAVSESHFFTKIINFAELI